MSSFLQSLSPWLSALCIRVCTYSPSLPPHNLDPHPGQFVQLLDLSGLANDASPLSRVLACDPASSIELFLTPSAAASLRSQLCPGGGGGAVELAAGRGGLVKLVGYRVTTLVMAAGRRFRPLVNGDPAPPGGGPALYDGVPRRVLPP
ncbi:hypothetical protein TeGR_g11224, partial [Tetraparma gracilis]